MQATPPPEVQEATGTLEAALQHARTLLDAEPALALQQAREILRAAGPHPRALLIEAIAQRRLGEVAQAVAALESLAARYPRSAETRFELGQALAAAGRGAEAIEALEQAVELRPAYPEAWRALGDHLGATGDEAGADAAYLRHIQCSTHDPRLMKAAAALAGKRLPEAERLLRAHLAEAPTDTAALRMLAEVAIRLGLNDQAEALLARCLSLAPSFTAARYNYAVALYRGNKATAALEQLETLLAADPRNPGYRNLQAVLLSRIGEYARATQAYEGLLAHYPSHGRVWLSYGHALKTSGRNREGIAAYRRALELDPAFGDAWWSLANLKTFRFEPADIVAMERELAHADSDPQNRSQLHFALGKALEDAGDYGRAFAQYEEGNAAWRGTIRYSADQTRARVERLKRDFDAAFFRERTGQGCPAPDPIFILGLPRAGSTLLEQILSSHSRVEGTMELPDIIAIAKDLRGPEGRSQPEYSTALKALGPEGLRELGERYLAGTRVHRKAGAPFFIDKMPNNFFHVGLIHAILPNARIIDARRHPLGCCFSNFKQHFARGQHFAYGLEDIGRFYHDYVELMAHFDAVLPGRIHRVFYEDMVEHTEREVRRLLDYCGLPFEEGCLRFFENDRAVRTASSEQVRQPIYRSGVDQWQHFEPWLGPLKAALGPVLEHYPAVPPGMATA